MLHHLGESGSKVWSEWHEMRQHARETAMSEEEFSEIMIEKYDLDTARITGADNPRTFTTDPYGPEEGVDIRDLHRR